MRWRTMRRGAVVVAGVLSGCLGLSREAAEQHHFVLEAQRPRAEQLPATGCMLELRPFYVAEAWAGKPFVYRTEGDEVATDFHHEFLVAPGNQIMRACQSWLQRSGIFVAVHAGGSRLHATHSLEVEVTELCGDWRGASPKAVLALHAVLLGPEAGLLFQKDYRAEEELRTGTEPARLVEAWNRALARLLTGLEADLRGMVAAAK